MVEGRLLYMPPCAGIQQEVAADVLYLLRGWSEDRPGFVVGGNEAGMKLGGDIRAADAAIWLRAEAGAATGRLRDTAPVLAVEIAGQDEDEPVLREKARWYVQHGVKVVWLVLPEHREVLVVTSESESRHGRGEHVPASAGLPGLQPQVDQLFAQLDRR